MIQLMSFFQSVLIAYVIFLYHLLFIKIYISIFIIEILYKFFGKYQRYLMGILELNKSLWILYY